MVNQRYISTIWGLEVQNLAIIIENITQTECLVMSYMTDNQKDYIV